MHRAKASIGLRAYAVKVIISINFLLIVVALFPTTGGPTERLLESLHGAYAAAWLTDTWFVLSTVGATVLFGLDVRKRLQGNTNSRAGRASLVVDGVLVVVWWIA